MPPLDERPSTPWQAGSFRGAKPQLLFGSMYEDPAIELAAFAPQSRVFCIAAAGCTARTLSIAGHDVTAVDINPEQLKYAKARSAGEPMREGVAERLLAHGREALPLLGWTKERRRHFLRLRNPEEQIQYWSQTLNRWRWRMAIDTLLSASLLRLFYASPFVGSLPKRFGQQIRARLLRGWTNHANQSNPYAWRLLLGENPSAGETNTRPIHFECADAAAYLEACKPGAFNAFSLSNIEDGASSEYMVRLRNAVEHAAAPGAVVVSRSFAEPAAMGNENWAVHDRSLLWGQVNVTRLGERTQCFIY